MSRRHLTLGLVLLAAALGTVALDVAALGVPYLTGRINDEAEMIPAEVRERLEAELAGLEDETGAQVVVLTVPSLEGETLEDYSLRVAETWELGRGDVDDGVLFLVARDDRKMRLEIGYGLEPTLTDALSSRILNDVVRPRFKAGDFGGGIEAGVGAIAGTIRGEEGVLPPPASDNVIENLGSGLPMGARFGMGAIFFLVVGVHSMSAIGKKGCGAWFLYVFLIPFWGTFPFAIFGLPWGGIFPVLWLVGFPILWIILHRTVAGRSYKKSHPWVTTIGSGRGGGWSSGGGFSGGGFSGGGGSFGGGGASSSW